MSMYIYSKNDGCKRREYQEMLDEMSVIEKNFYKEHDSSNHQQSLTFEKETNFITKAMKKYAISRKFFLYPNLIKSMFFIGILTLLDKLYEHRHRHTRKLLYQEFCNRNYEDKLSYFVYFMFRTEKIDNGSVRRAKTSYSQKNLERTM